MGRQTDQTTATYVLCCFSNIRVGLRGLDGRAGARIGGGDNLRARQSKSNTDGEELTVPLP